MLKGSHIQAVVKFVLLWLIVPYLAARYFTLGIALLVGGCCLVVWVLLLDQVHAKTTEWSNTLKVMARGKVGILLLLIGGVALLAVGWLFWAYRMRRVVPTRSVPGGNMRVEGRPAGSKESVHEEAKGEKKETAHTVGKHRVASCVVTATTKSELVARVFMRGPLPRAPQTEVTLEPTIQELFFDWTLTVISTRDAGKTSVILRDPRKPTYRLSVRPETATVSDVGPGWMSGFAEPRDPDYYKRTITFRHLERASMVTVRRPVRVLLGNNQMDASSFPVSDFDVTTDSSCKVDIPEKEDPQKRFLRLMIQFATFAEWKHGKDKKPLKIHLDPDEPMPPLEPGESEASVEMHCQDADCKHVLIRQLEARRKP